MRLLNKLLLKNVSKWQTISFAIANIVGAVIVLFGVQAYKDASSVLRSGDSIIGNNFVVLSKPVSTANTVSTLLGEDPSAFSQEELQEIASLPGVKAASGFRTASFNVYGIISMGDINLSTEMFLESIPDGFLDLDEESWTADVYDTQIPIVIPRTYLNFYNYGFANSIDGPQIGEALFSMVPIDIVCSGKGRQVRYQGIIVGLTDRVNTILVPDDFLIEANQYFSNDSDQKPTTRVIVASDGSSADELMKYVEEKGFVYDGPGEESVRMLSIVRTIISIVVALGLFVSALSFFLLFISILLIIEKNRYKIDTLHQLGYSDSKIARPYQIFAAVIDFVVWISAGILTIVFYPKLSELMQTISPAYVPDGPGLVLITSVILAVVFSLIHFILIRSKVSHKFK